MVIVKPNNKYMVLMDIINRREWFKRTSKILPVLFLSFFPIARTYSKPSMTCNNACRYYCVQSCHNTHKTGCSTCGNACQKGCTVTCRYSGKCDSCSDSCKGCCTWSCNTSCTSSAKDKDTITFRR